MARSDLMSAVEISGTGLETCLNFQALPVWQGLQREPGVRRTHPFSLGFTGPGPIHLKVSEQFLGQLLAGYGAEDYNFLTALPGHSAWANSQGDRKVAAALRHCPACPPKAILEVGAGSPYVGECLLDRLGNDTTYMIVDPAITGASDRIEIHRDYFRPHKLAGRRFDLVLGFACLEHLPDPLTFLQDISAVLTPGGRVIMMYPDVSQALMRGDLNALLHEHLTYFTETSTRWLAAACGLEVVALDSDHDALTAVFHKPHGFVPSPPALCEESILHAAHRAFQALLVEQGREIAALLDAGRVVGFHGATNGLNTFLHLTGLGGHPRVKVFDGDISKADLFLPACENVVRHVSDPSYAEVDVIYVSALSFFDAIARDALDRHGIAGDRLRRLEA